MKYFRADFHLNPGTVWSLSDASLPDGKKVWGEEFRTGKRHQNIPGLAVRVHQAGLPLDFSFTPFGAIVVSERASVLLARHFADVVDLHPVAIIGENGQFYIANFFHIIQCLNVAKSGAVAIQKKSSNRSTDTTYMHVPKLVINRNQIPISLDAFRIKGWTGPLLVSDRMKSAIEFEKFTGLFFELVTLVGDAE